MPVGRSLFLPCLSPWARLLPRAGARPARRSPVAAEHEHVRVLVLADRAQDGAIPSRHRQHRVARARRPGGRRYRPPGCSPERGRCRCEGGREQRRRIVPIAAARSNGVSPSTTAVQPSGRGTSRPRRITCASSERSEPFGSSRSSVSSVAVGSSELSESRIGAPRGPVSTDAAMPVIRSSWSTSTMAVGRSASPVAGQRVGDAAASAAASAPPTRTVLRVALPGSRASRRPVRRRPRRRRPPAAGSSRLAQIAGGEGQSQGQ